MSDALHTYEVMLESEGKRKIIEFGTLEEAVLFALPESRVASPVDRTIIVYHVEKDVVCFYTKILEITAYRRTYDLP